MTEEELIEIENRLLAATKGKWIPMIEGITHTSGDSFIMTNVEKDYDWRNPNRGEDIYITNGGNVENDLIFIANSKQDIPLLIAEIRKLKNNQ